MKTNRAYGLDLLRILSMMMVLVLHVFSNGSALDHLVPGTANYFVGWLLEAMCFCAVDIFAVMTGYLMVDRKTEYWKFIPRWLQAWVFSVGITTLYSVFAGGGQVSAKEWLTCLFPLTYSQWKYLTEYFAVVLFMPYINLAIKHMTAQQHRTVLLMILGFSVWTTCSFTDPMNLKSGYSVIWIVLLYIAGALVKKTGLDKCVSQECALIGFVLCALLAYGSKVVEVLLDSRLTRLTKGTGFLMSYVSPVVLLCAFFLLIYFSQVKQIPDRWIPGIRWMSSVSFGVFLIHTQIIVRTRLYKDAFIWITTQNTGVFLAVIIVSAIGIYLLCGSVEYLRQRLFSYMRIDNKSQKLYNAVKIRIIRHMNIFFGK